jgi:hypothetical protein
MFVIQAAYTEKAPAVGRSFVWIDRTKSPIIVLGHPITELHIMPKDSLEIASLMLRSMVAGASCEQIAGDFGVTKSAVSQKTRMLANDLQQIVGVVGVEEDESPTAALIRHHGDAYLEALEHFVPDAASAWRGQVVELASCRLDQHIAKIARHSRCVERDAALLLILFSTAAKPLEIAQLEVRDYLDELGEVRIHSSIRSEIAVNGKERPLLFCDPTLTAAIDAYLVLRRAEGMATHHKSAYRGLQPHSRLFLSRDGKPMAVKRSGSGSQHLVCKEIHEIYRRIFAHAGHSGINTAMARRLAARRLHLAGASTEEIGAALGVKKLAVHKLLQSIDGEAGQPRARATGNTQPGTRNEGSQQVWRTA